MFNLVNYAYSQSEQYVIVGKWGSAGVDDDWFGDIGFCDFFHDF